MATALVHSQSPISLISSPSSSFVRTLSHTSSSPPASQASGSLSQSSKTSSPTLYAAFKVLTLVNALRKRVKTRSPITRKLQSGKTKKFYQDFERQAYDEIDRYLGRPRRRSPQARVNEVAAINPDSSEHSIEGLLNIVESSASINGHSLSTLASSNEFFLNRKSEFHIQHFSVKELAEIIVHVRDLLETLHRAAPPARAFPPSKSDPAIDLTYLSNLEHLLLCLQQQLFGLFIVDCIELLRHHISECQKDYERYCEEWFFEYPDARHPLSTTWPWAIKPSLAVLWGVCWMFIANDYCHLDNDMNLVESSTGRILLFSDQVHNVENLNLFAAQNQYAAQNLSKSSLGMPAAVLSSWPAFGACWQSRRYQGPFVSSLSVSEGSSVFNGNARQSVIQDAGIERRLAYIRIAVNRNLGYNGYNRRISPMTPPNAERRVAQQPFQAHHNATASHTDSAHNFGDFATFQAADPRGLDATASNTFAQPPVTASTDTWLPEAQHNQFPVLGNSNNAYSAGQADSSWRDTSQPASTNQLYSQSQSSRPPRPENFAHVHPLPHQGRHLHPPPIHVTIPANNTGYLRQPQDSQDSSASSYGPHSGLTPTDPNYLNTLNPYSRQRYSTPMATTEQPPLEGNMQGPVSPSLEPIQQSLRNSPLQSPHPEHAQRKRSFSEMSRNEITISQAIMQAGQTPERHEQDSYNPTSEPSPTFQDDTFRQRSLKRPDPPMTAEGKYWCNFSNECSGQLFDRKCEWSKHMDKHDRPYRCPQPQCAKLQGFTYSGGLLRHEREVHGKHGGPKEQLRCTVPDCKRHTGKGFTRKENLNEHLRRVHGIITDGSQLRQMAADAVPGAEAAETPVSRFSDNHEMDDLTGISPPYPMPEKRRRLDHITSPHSASDEVESELARLRAENLAKDERIQRVEQEHAETQLRLQKMETMLQSLTANGLNKAEAEEQKLQREM